MARAPDPKAAQAKELFLRGMKLIDISKALGVPVGTIRSWKNRYNWDENSDATLQKKKRNVAKVKGGHQATKMLLVMVAQAHREIKTQLPQESSRLSFLIAWIQTRSSWPQQCQTIRSSSCSRRSSCSLFGSAGCFAGSRTCVGADFTTVKKKKGTEKDKWTDLNEEHATLGQIQHIEDALTRVQARKQAAIDSLHRYGVDDARLEIEMMRLDLAALKLGGQETEVEEDGFLEALNTEAGDLWGDPNDD